MAIRGYVSLWRRISCIVVVLFFLTPSVVSRCLPELSVSETLVRSITGDDVSVNCFVTCGMDPLNLEWETPDGHKINSGDKRVRVATSSSTSLALHIDSVTSEDEGKYVCSLHTYTKSVRLIVLVSDESNGPKEKDRDSPLHYVYVRHRRQASTDVQSLTTTISAATSSVSSSKNASVTTNTMHFTGTETAIITQTDKTTTTKSTSMQDSQSTDAVSTSENITQRPPAPANTANNTSIPETPIPSSPASNVSSAMSTVTQSTLSVPKNTSSTVASSISSTLSTQRPPAPANTANNTSIPETPTPSSPASNVSFTMSTVTQSTRSVPKNTSSTVASSISSTMSTITKSTLSIPKNTSSTVASSIASTQSVTDNTTSPSGSTTMSKASVSASMANTSSRVSPTAEPLKSSTDVNSGPTTHTGNTVKTTVKMSITSTSAPASTKDKMNQDNTTKSSPGTGSSTKDQTRGLSSKKSTDIPTETTSSKGGVTAKACDENTFFGQHGFVMFFVAALVVLLLLAVICVMAVRMCKTGRSGGSKELPQEERYAPRLQMLEVRDHGNSSDGLQTLSLDYDKENGHNKNPTKLPGAVDTPFAGVSSFMLRKRPGQDAGNTQRNSELMNQRKSLLDSPDDEEIAFTCNMKTPGEATAQLEEPQDKSNKRHSSTVSKGRGSVKMRVEELEGSQV